jgi:rare lipoprotein A
MSARRTQKHNQIELFLGDLAIRKRCFVTFIACCAMLALCSTGCARKKPRTAKIPRTGDTEVGIASWYGNPYHGRRTASGEVYDMEKLTAAHRTLPFQTWVKVENLSNGKAVDVRINDRGPFVRGRVIDLSRAAARSIELLGPGVLKVRIEVIEKPNFVSSAPPPPAVIESPATGFGVQVGAFRDRDNATRLSEELHQRFGSVRIVPREGNFTMWRVIVGDVSTEEEAAGLLEQLADVGMDGFVVRLDPPPPMVGRE